MSYKNYEFIMKKLWKYKVYKMDGESLKKIKVWNILLYVW